MAYDEERQEWARPTKARRAFPRLRRASLFLFLIDILIVGVLLRTFEPLITLLYRNEELFGPRLILHQNATSESVPPIGPGGHKIPRILHQTTATDDIPEKWAVPQQSCKDVYSDFEYKLWTDARAREFIASHYPWFLETWDEYPFAIQRADSIRYLILHHFGGIYLDMDIYCNRTFPFEQIEAGATSHIAVFESTLPTGVTNDFMISSAGHPAMAAAVAKLPPFQHITRVWARLAPYAAIMISSGPFFITLVLKNFLLAQPSLPTQAVQVVHAEQLRPFITDLQSCSWHQADAHTLMWVGNRPWSWFAMGVVGLVIGLYVLNNILLRLSRGVFGRVPAMSASTKFAKLI